MEWTKKQIEILQKNYYDCDKEELIKLIDKKWRAIACKGWRLGLKRKMGNPGESNSQWKGGVTIYRQLAFSKYPHRCNCCGSEKKLEVHHIDRNRRNNSINNLVILCEKCHKQFHCEMRGWSLKYECCICCGTKKLKHNAKGLCVNCYMRKIYNKKEQSL